MTISDRAEEMMEKLWVEIMENKNEKYDIAALGDGETIKELERAGHIRIKDNHLILTHAGEKEARDCIRRHRLAERLLVDLLDFKKKTVHDQGCKFEHLLHKGLDENICTLLGHPRTCPHGRPIPPGRCCGDAKRMPKKALLPLSELNVNKKARIAYLQTHDPDALQKIVAMGALPGRGVALIHKFPSYVFQIGKSQFAVDKELASHIYVRAG